MTKIKKESSYFASFRVFELLKFLSQKYADMQEIIDYMEMIDPEGKSYSKATIYKYLATFKAMGVETPKFKGKFHIQALPFNFDFEKQDIRAIKLIEKLTPIIAEKDLKQDINDVIEQLLPKFSTEMKEYFNSIKVRDIQIPRIFNKTEIELINRFKKYILDDFKLNLTYKNDKNEIVKTSVNPIEIKYIDNDVYFKFFHSINGNVISVQMEKVLEMVQLPQKTHKNFVPTTTTFSLSGKLAKRYVLKEDEKSIGLDDNGNLIVLNQREDKFSLTRRLLGYGELCRIISPKSQQFDITAELDEMLKNYK